MMQRRASRRGYTLVEIGISVGLVSLVLLVLFSVFHGGLKNLHRGGMATEATLSTLMAAEAIEAALEGAFIDTANAEQPVTVEQDGHRLVFYRADASNLDRRRAHGVREEIEATANADGTFGLSVCGRRLTSVRLADCRFEFHSATDPTTGGVHFVRVRLWGCDSSGKRSSPLLLLKAIELPTFVLREKLLRRRQ